MGAVAPGSCRSWAQDPGAHVTLREGGHWGRQVLCRSLPRTENTPVLWCLSSAPYWERLVTCPLPQEFNGSSAEQTT